MLRGSGPKNSWNLRINVLTEPNSVRLAGGMRSNANHFALATPRRKPQSNQQSSQTTGSATRNWPEPLPFLTVSILLTITIDHDFWMLQRNRRFSLRRCLPHFGNQPDRERPLSMKKAAPRTWIALDHSV
tara:strand:+ start:1878 stop:2267 length:390 start_codon:yes stop_codon:yes gene_type:complete